MKTKEKKVLKAKLLTAFKHVLKDNNAYLSNKAENKMIESIKQIVKKTDKKRTARNQTKRPVLSAPKVKLDGAINSRLSGERSNRT